jgi:hypothetical protein
MIYTFRNKKTGRTKEYTIRLADYDKFKEDHPELERIIDVVVLNYSSGGINSLSTQAARKSEGWKEVLTKIGEQNPHSPLAQEFHRNKSVNRIKAETIVDKHVKIQSKQRQARAARRK